MVLLDKRGHHFTIGREGADGRLLILAHEAAVAFDIGTEDGSELAFHTHLPRGDYPAGASCLSNGGDFADAQP